MWRSTLGSYRLHRVLGQGGMGVVYEAEHQLLGRRAAVKLLLPDHTRSPDVVNRFFNEARATSLIHHPGIVEILDFGYDVDGSAYIVMELLEGESLGARLARDPRLPSDLVIAIGRGIAAALGAAHRKGIIHRDLKPDNVFLVPDPDMPGGVRPKILDFGIAKLVRDQSATSLRTRTGSVLGTPLYMSPEQCRGGGATIDQRSDIYSLGCILFEAACGRPPFLAEGLGDLFVAHLRDTPPPPRSLRPDLPPVLDDLIARMLAKDPGERPQSMDDVVAQLDARAAFIAAATTLGNAAAQVVPAPAPRRGRLLAGGAMVVLAAAGVAVVQARRDEPPPAPVPAAAPAPPPAPVLVRQTIESSPPGAEVLQGEVALGTTPLVRAVARAPGRTTLRLRKEGYVEASVEVSTEGDTMVSAALAPAPPPAPTPAAPPPEPPRPRPHAKPAPARPAPSPAPPAPPAPKGDVRVKDDAVDPFAH
jgi:serine/threonine-protein kinase